LTEQQTIPPASRQKGQVYPAYVTAYKLYLTQNTGTELAAG